nr:class I SAM-dependent methyltransferase [uncultured Butyrivibrio sp.]
MDKDIANRNLGMKAHKCRLCGASGLFQSYLVKEMMIGTGDEFEYFVCADCGSIQIAEIPDNLGAYYGEKYYSYLFHTDNQEAFDTEIDERRKILDVGCGSGSWLFEMAKQGCGNLYGCDPFIDDDIAYGDRVHIKKCDITEMEGDNSFSLIRMGDSLEHVINPIEVLNNARRLLETEGELWIRIPIFPNFVFDMFGTFWYQLDAPRHILIPSVKAIKYLADNCGFQFLNIRYRTVSGAVVRSFLYQHGYWFYEHTPEVRKKYFPDEIIPKVDDICEKEDRNGYGDHVDVWMMKRHVIV